MRRKQFLSLVVAGSPPVSLRTRDSFGLHRDGKKGFHLALRSNKQNL